MRAVGCVLVALLAAGSAAGQEPKVFGPGNYLRATHIVVTDPDGRVLECWRGDLWPGAVVRLGVARRAPADALPWEFVRLRPDVSRGGAYRLHTRDPLDSFPWPSARDAATGLRLVLFLRQETPIAGIPTVWIPALARADGEPVWPTFGQYRFDAGSRGSRYLGSDPSPFVPKDDFASCVALIEGGRVLACQTLSSNQELPNHLMPVALSVESFRRAVEYVPPLAFPEPAPTRRVGPLRSWAEYDTLIPSLPHELPPPKEPAP